MPYIHDRAAAGGGGSGGGDTRDRNLSKTTKKFHRKNKRMTDTKLFSFLTRRSFSFSPRRGEEGIGGRCCFSSFCFNSQTLTKLSLVTTQKNMKRRKTKKNPLLSLGSTCLTLQLTLGYIHRASPRPLIHRPSTGDTVAQMLHSEARRQSPGSGAAHVLPPPSLTRH